MTLRRRQAEQTRVLLLDAAARVFARKGFARARIDDVAAEAGSSKGAVYHHFPSKHALFRALMAHRAAGLEPLGDLADRSSSLAELIDGLVDLWLERTREHREETALALEARVRALHDPEAAALLGEYHRAMREVIDGLVGAAALRFDAVPPGERPGLVVFGTLDGVTQQWALDQGALDPEDLRRTLVQALTALLDSRAR